MHPTLTRFNRVLRINAALFLLTGVATPARADIFQWEYVNPADPSQGKQQSSTLAPDGAGVNAVPGADFSKRNLTMANLTGADLRNANGYQTILTKANLTQANFINAYLVSAALTDADLTDAMVR